MPIDRPTVFKTLYAELDASLAIATQAANDAKALATHEQSKPETQYDTLGLEASYLAHGQSQRVNDIKLAIEDWQFLQQKTFNDDSLISAGALVGLTDSNNRHTYYLLGNHSGGHLLKSDSGDIRVISVSSPMGQKLLGQTIDEEIAPLNSKAQELVIFTIC